MTDNVVQFRDYQQPKDLERLRAEQTLEQQAIETATIALMGEPGVPGFWYEDFSSGRVTDYMPSDTSPCEYTAPDQDSA